MANSRGFVGRENAKKQTKFVIVWGGNSKLRGGSFPPKDPEKNTELQYSVPTVL